MEFSKRLLGSEATTDAAGVLAMNHPLPRPERENALGQRLTDGPYEYFDVQRCEHISAHVVVDGGPATVNLEGTNNDPTDPAATWAVLDTTGAVDGTGAPVADTLYHEGRIRFARIAWSGASSDPLIQAEVFAGN